MGNLYRFTEPIVLLALAHMGTAHGYQIASEATPMAVTHAGVDGAAVYRALRRLESTRCVTSKWDTAGAGPARRIYSLTPRGWEHLGEWVEVLDSISGGLSRLLRGSRQAIKASGQPSAGNKTTA